ncbi:MAG: T9SS type A sorting domain-containing protein, partial [Saprospiraceae bacterium]
GSCQDPVNIILSKTTLPYKCDSTYDLYVAILNATGRVREYCQRGMIICEVMPIDKTCNVNGYSTEGFEYKWYLKSDIGKKTFLGTDEFIEVPLKDDYCVDITVTGRLDKLSKKCTFTVCELFNEDEFKYQQICPKGSLEICVGDTTSFSVEGSFPSDARHIWTVGGGVIVTQNPISNKTIEVLWNFDPSPNNSYDGIICYHMESSCPETPECCINVKVHYNHGTVNAGPDEQVRGLKNTLKAEPTYSGTWTMVKGPGIATFKNANDSKSSVQVNRFGIYTFKWTINCGINYSDEVNITFLRVRVIGGTGKQGRDSCCVDPGNFSELGERSTLRSYSIVPNPIQEKHFQIQGGSLETTSELMIIDLQGKKIFEKNLNCNTSTQEIELGQDVISGIYYLRIQDKDGNYWADKLLIIH